MKKTDALDEEKWHNMLGTFVKYWFLFFFFSSRRRHTRWPRDWSSDVCSSDLPPRHIQQFLVGRQSNQNRPHVNTDRCLVIGVVGSSRPGLATCRPPRSQRRRTGSAPSKSAKDEPIGPPPVGGDYALLPLGLALLSSHRTRRAFCPGGAECGACGSRSGYLRSFAGRKLPADASGGGTGDK